MARRRYALINKEQAAAGASAIGDLSDVTISGVASDDLLQWNGSAWVNVTAVADGNIPESAITQHEAAIDHDALLNFVAAEHIDWTVTGAEDIHVDRITSAAVTQHEGDINHNALLNYAANEHRVWEASIAQNIHADNITQGSVTQHQAAIDHDALTNFVANEHIDWTGDQGATNIHVNNITGLTTSNFSSANVSQWTNDSGYITSVSGEDHGALTGLGDNDHPQYALLTGANTFTTARSGDTHPIEMASNNPFMMWNETGSGSDEKKWHLGVAGTSFLLRTLDDTGANGSDVIRINRSGTTIDGIELNADTIDVGSGDIQTINSLVFNNTESSSQTDTDGRLIYDTNVGTSDYPVSATSRGSLQFYNSQDGWGLIFDTQNMDVIQAEFAELYLNSNGGSLFLEERASAGSSTAGRGQVWVKNEAPNELWFTDDGGFDHHVAGGALTENFGVTKTSDENVTGSTTLQDDDELFLPVVNGATYLVTVILSSGSSSTNPDLKINFDVPTGSTGIYELRHYEQSPGSLTPVTRTQNDWETAAGSLQLNTSGSSAPAITLIQGILTAGATGTLQLEWAQQNSDSSFSTQMFAGSSMAIQRLA